MKVLYDTIRTDMKAFAEIACGAIFSNRRNVKNGGVFMKMGVVRSDVPGKDQELFNAIRISDGAQIFFPDEFPVAPIDASIVVEKVCGSPWYSYDPTMAEAEEYNDDFYY